MQREIPPMRYKRLGRTGLMVSTLSLGSGGINRFGQRRFILPQRIFDLIRFALDIGVNLFDTAPSYGESEAMLGEALKEIPRDGFIIATKIDPVVQDRIASSREIVGSIDRSLKKLRVDRVDLLQFHAVLPYSYRAVVDSVMPTLEKLRAEGKFRFLGITESSLRDPNHEMLSMALSDDIFDTVMVAYDPGNPSAGKDVVRRALEKNVGVICMTAARSVASLQNDVGKLIPGLNPRYNRALMNQAVRLQSADSVSMGRDPLTPAVAYRLAVSHPAVSTVLTGTTHVEHLRQNALAVLVARL
jgi:aryl-alcohol dehydrogenase-like predicted oxidoreductase